MKSNIEKSVVSVVLEEELDRNARMANRYLIELQKLPKGSIYKRKLGNQAYYYLKFRDSGNSVNKYLGNTNTTDISKISKEINKRKHIENVVKRLEKERREIVKALSGREKK